MSDALKFDFEIWRVTSPLGQYFFASGPSIVDFYILSKWNIVLIRIRFNF